MQKLSKFFIKLSNNIIGNEKLISHSQLFFNNIVSGLWFKSKKIYMKWG